MPTDHRHLGSLFVWLTLGLVSLLPAGAAAEDRVTLQPRPGITEQVLFTIVNGAPASVILLPGGGGVLDSVRNNFLLRVKDQFSQQGLNVAVPDAPSDHTSGMGPPFRAGAEHAQDIAAVIAFLKSKSPVPVWLVGTSRGTISAANGAARLGPAEVAGIVLTSTVWLGGMSGVSLDQVAVPTLVVHNHDDGCVESPFSGAQPGIAALTKAPAKELIAVTGGKSQSRPCDALSPHGYFGIEYQVVPPIIQWIKTHK